MDRRDFLASLSGVFGLSVVTGKLGGIATMPLPAYLEFANDRFARAEEFMQGLDYHGSDYVDFLYRAGIVTQLGLTAFLFSRGFDDDWCRREIGLNVDRGLRFANHFGLNCDCPRIAALTQTLGNYGQWRGPVTVEIPTPGSLILQPSVEDVRSLMRRVQIELQS